MGSAYSDVVRGTPGNDFLQGDDFFRDGGSDSFYGDKGNDVIEDGYGDDRLFGGSGDDILDGGQGGDKLDGGLDSDILTGGKNADEFIFRENFGHDEITDFTDGVDLIRMDIASVSFSDLTITDDGNDTQVSLAGHGTITLRDVSSYRLTEDDFIFV